jgi:hypothetical protein
MRESDVDSEDPIWFMLLQPRRKMVEVQLPEIIDSTND